MDIVACNILPRDTDVLHMQVKLVLVYNTCFPNAIILMLLDISLAFNNLSFGCLIKNLKWKQGSQ